MKRAELKLNRRGFAKAMFFAGSLMVAGIAAGCGVQQQTGDNESNPQKTGSEQTPEDKESDDGSSTRDDGSSS